MRDYQTLMKRVLEEGELRKDRTGFGTRSLFGECLKFDLTRGFPAVTTKKLAFRQVAAELCCFLRGYDTLAQFHSVGCTIWDANGEDDRWLDKVERMGMSRGSGYLGPIYGVAWRRWSANGKLGFDQLREAIHTLANDAYSRRAVVTAWNPALIGAMCLPPCHTMFQLSLRERNGVRLLDVGVTMRSVDVFLGMPFDIASYALLTHIIARRLMAEPGRVSFWFGDTHVYLNHVDQAYEQLSRWPRKLPKLLLAAEATVDNFHPDMAHLEGYDSHPAIKADMNP